MGLVEPRDNVGLKIQDAVGLIVNDGLQFA